MVQLTDNLAVHACAERLQDGGCVWSCSSQHRVNILGADVASNYSVYVSNRTVSDNVILAAVLEGLELKHLFYLTDSTELCPDTYEFFTIVSHYDGVVRLLPVWSLIDLALSDDFFSDYDCYYLSSSSSCHYLTVNLHNLATLANLTDKVNKNEIGSIITRNNYYHLKNYSYKYGCAYLHELVPYTPLTFEELFLSCATFVQESARLVGAQVAIKVPTSCEKGALTLPSMSELARSRDDHEKKKHKVVVKKMATIIEEGDNTSSDTDVANSTVDAIFISKFEQDTLRALELSKREYEQYSYDFSKPESFTSIDSKLTTAVPEMVLEHNKEQQTIMQMIANAINYSETYAPEPTPTLEGLVFTCQFDSAEDLVISLATPIMLCASKLIEMFDTEKVVTLTRLKQTCTDFHARNIVVQMILERPSLLENSLFLSEYTDEVVLAKVALLRPDLSIDTSHKDVLIDDLVGYEHEGAKVITTTYQFIQDVLTETVQVTIVWHIPAFKAISIVSIFDDTHKCPIWRIFKNNTYYVENCLVYVRGTDQGGISLLAKRMKAYEILVVNMNLDARILFEIDPLFQKIIEIYYGEQLEYLPLQELTRRLNRIMAAEYGIREEHICLGRKE